MAERKRVESSGEPSHFEERTLVEPTQFSDLPYACLRSIFSFLSANDLCVLKETSERFVEAADDEFRHRYRHQTYIFGPQFADVADRANFSSALKVVRLFGRFISAISVYNIVDERDEDVWNDIFEFCVALKHLRISGCTLQHCHFSEDCGLLESIHFRNCTGDDMYFTVIIDSSEKLKRIVVEFCCDGSGFDGEFLESQYPDLEEITIRRNGINFSTIRRLNFRLRQLI